MANRIREAYRAYQTGQNSEDEVNLVFSIRGSEWIAARMGLGIDVRQACMDVILPKADDSDERVVLETIIQNVDEVISAPVV